jgi:hypothetical protein
MTDEEVKTRALAAAMFGPVGFACYFWFRVWGLA